MYHKDLVVWKESINLVTLVYQITEDFPSDERFGLTFQVRRAAVSVPSNIAEGCGRGTDKDLLHFLDMASGSLSETETQILIAKNLGYIDECPIVDEKVAMVQKLLVGFRKRIKDNINKPE